MPPATGDPAGNTELADTGIPFTKQSTEPEENLKVTCFKPVTGYVLPILFDVEPNPTEAVVVTTDRLVSWVNNEEVPLVSPTYITVLFPLSYEKPVNVWFVNRAAGDAKLANPEVNPGIGEPSREDEYIAKYKFILSSIRDLLKVCEVL